MKLVSLTYKQQAKAANKIFRILKDLGFQCVLPRSPGQYWWRKIPGTETRLCVGYGIPDQCLGGVEPWAWQDAPLDKEPLFGYSGTTSLGLQAGTVERVIDITLDKVYRLGIASGVACERKKMGEAKKTITEAVSKLSEVLHSV